jgi:hypothetical protein
MDGQQYCDVAGTECNQRHRHRQCDVDGGGQSVECQQSEWDGHHRRPVRDSDAGGGNGERDGESDDVERASRGWDEGRDGDGESYGRGVDGEQSSGVADVE